MLYMYDGMGNTMEVYAEEQPIVISEQIVTSSEM